MGPGHYDAEKGYTKLVKSKPKGFKISTSERRTYFDQSNTLDIGPGEYENGSFKFI